MNDEEKQQDFTSQLPDEPGEVSPEILDESFGSVEELLTVEQALEDEQLGEAEAQTSEAVAESADFSLDEGDAEVGEAEAEYAAVIEALTLEVESLKAQLEISSQQSESVKNQYVRIVKDFENFRQRTQKEKEELEQQIKRATITELLPVVDNFERARSLIKPQTDPERNIQKSYQGVYKQLADSLKRIGVSPMRPEGKEFDPNLHEAVIREQSTEYPEGTVIEELVRGYFINDKVLRHALVKVAAAMEPVVTSEEGHPEENES